MQILERSITRQNWEPAYRFLTRKVRVECREVAGATMVPGAGGRVYYAVFVDTGKGRRPVGWLRLHRQVGWSAWEVEQLWVFPEYRGRGLAGHLYKAAINGDGLMVASGKTHTKHSKALWESFVRKETFNIWAHDFKDLTSRHEVLWEDNEIFCALELYSPSKSKSDVRLIAIKRTS